MNIINVIFIVLTCILGLLGSFAIIAFWLCDRKQ